MEFVVGQIVFNTMTEKTGTVTNLSLSIGKLFVDYGDGDGPKIASPEYLKPVKASKKNVNLLEWKDPLTGEEHTCPKQYVAGILSVLGIGAAAAKTATAILEQMGEKTVESNKRHLRQASLYLRQSGVQVISVRSSQGGYFIAETPEEVSAYTNFQRKLAQSMILEADQLDAVTVGQSISKFNGLK